VADLGRIGDALSERGYSEADVEDILGGNWLRVLRRGLPE
jgi:membrane dipeptidase